MDDASTGLSSTGWEAKVPVGRMEPMTDASEERHIPVAGRPRVPAEYGIETER